MDSIGIFDSINKLLTTSFAREFWLYLMEELEASYASAHAVVEGTAGSLKHPEKIRFRPQARHYFLNAAFRRAAEASGLICIDAVTQPQGEHYCLVESGGIKVSRIGLNHNEHLIKRARHRALLAELNGELEGVTPDMFYDIAGVETAKETLGVLIVNVNPPHTKPQGSMLDLRVTVPFTNLRNYHYNQSIRDVLALYNTADNQNEIPDLAVPQLKKRLKQQEG